MANKFALIISFFLISTFIFAVEYGTWDINQGMLEIKQGTTPIPTNGLWPLPDSHYIMPAKYFKVVENKVVEKTTEEKRIIDLLEKYRKLDKVKGIWEERTIDQQKICDLDTKFWTTDVNNDYVRLYTNAAVLTTNTIYIYYTKDLWEVMSKEQQDTVNSNLVLAAESEKSAIANPDNWETQMKTLGYTTWQLNCDTRQKLREANPSLNILNTTNFPDVTIEQFKAILKTNLETNYLETNLETNLETIIEKKIKHRKEHRKE